MKRRADPSPGYRLWLRPAVHRDRRRLPGNVRQRIKRLLDDLQREPRPPESRVLELPDSIPRRILEAWEVRRARVEDWRVVYAIAEGEEQVAILLVARRPPYRYEDIQELLEELPEAT